MPKPFHTSRFVEFSDTDMAGIMHFSAFFRYMEAAEHELLRSLGFSVYTEIDDDVVSFPRVAASCEFHSPARCEDVLDIDVTVRRVGHQERDLRFSVLAARPRRGHRRDDECLLPRPAWRGAVSIPIPGKIAISSAMFGGSIHRTNRQDAKYENVIFATRIDRNRGMDEN